MVETVGIPLLAPHIPLFVYNLLNSIKRMAGGIATLLTSLINEAYNSNFSLQGVH